MEAEVKEKYASPLIKPKESNQSTVRMNPLNLRSMAAEVSWWIEITGPSWLEAFDWFSLLSCMFNSPKESVFSQNAAVESTGLKQTSTVCPYNVWMEVEGTTVPSCPE